MNPSDPQPEELQARIRALRESTAEPKSGGGAARSPGGLAFRFATDIVAGVGVGTAVGYFIDQWLGTMPVFLLICMGLGTAGSFLTIYRANLHYAAELEKEEKERLDKRDQIP